MPGPQSPNVDPSADADKLTAAQRSKIRRLSAPRELAPDEEAGELNIIPFLDIITNVMMFVLASISVSFTTTLDADQPKGGSKGVRARTTEQTLNLTVLVTTAGYMVKGKNATLGPGCLAPCTSATCPPTVPRVSAAPNESSDNLKFDPEGLRKCLRALKNELAKAGQAGDENSLTFAHEQQVMVIANDSVPFQEIVRVMDAVHGDEAGGCKAFCAANTDVDKSTPPKMLSEHPVRQVCYDTKCQKECGEDPSKCSELFPKVVFSVLASSK